MQAYGLLCYFSPKKLASYDQDIFSAVPDAVFYVNCIFQYITVMEEKECLGKEGIKHNLKMDSSHSKLGVLTFYYSANLCRYKEQQILQQGIY